MKLALHVLVLLVLSTAALAANVSIVPSTLYETTTGWLAADVNNFQGNAVINRVRVDSGLSVNAAQQYIGWTTNSGSSFAEWTNGALGTNVRSAWFEYQTSAPNVSTNTVVSTNVTLNNQTVLLNVTVLNDATPPAITNIAPNGYVRANNPSQQVSITAVDNETSVASVTFTFNDCAGSPNTSVALTQSNNTFSGTANFSAFNEGSRACYTATTRNAPGEQSSVSGQLLFDGTAPTVTLGLPATYATESTTFTFSASDNIAANLTCSVSLNNTQLALLSVPNATVTNTTQNLSGFAQGSSEWKVSCTDGVGLLTQGTRTLIVDTQAPQITSLVLPTLLRTQNGVINATIIDRVGVSSVNATFDGAAVALTRNGNSFSAVVSSNTLGNKTFTLEARDDAGHVTTYATTIEVVPNHQISLTLNPASTNPNQKVDASGTITRDGAAVSTQVILGLPDGNVTLNLSNDAYVHTFNAPLAGSYLIVVYYIEGGYTYTQTAALTVTAVGQQQVQIQGTSGIGADAWRSSGYVKPKDEPSNEGDSSQEEVVEEQEEPTTKPQEEYKPLPAEPARSAITPKSTSIFDLGTTIKWLGILLVTGLIAGLGAYAYKNRPRGKDEQGIDWDAYFSK